jgi:hypothetical protein
MEKPTIFHGWDWQRAWASGERVRRRTRRASGGRPCSRNRCAPRSARGVTRASAWRMSSRAGGGGRAVALASRAATARLQQAAAGSQQPSARASPRCSVATFARGTRAAVPTAAHLLRRLHNQLRAAQQRQHGCTKVAGCVEHLVSDLDAPVAAQLGRAIMRQLPRPRDANVRACAILRCRVLTSQRRVLAAAASSAAARLAHG